jgi:hypothetical protein
LAESGKGFEKHGGLGDDCLNAIAEDENQWRLFLPHSQAIQSKPTLLKMTGLDLPPPPPWIDRLF